MQTHLKPEWNMILGGMAIVFAFQVIRPFLGPLFKRGNSKSRTMPVLTEPMRRGLIFLLLAIALVWPSFTGRAEGSISTLVPIYVMMALAQKVRKGRGMGKRVAVGLARGCRG